MPDASVKVVVSTAAITHVSNGTSIGSSAMMPSSDTATSIGSSNHGRYPRADVVLSFTHTGSISSASNVVALYRRDIDVDGTGDEPIPGTAYASASNVTPSFYKAKYVGAFVANAVSITVTSTSAYSQYLVANDVALPAGSCEFYIENLTNATILAGWTLKVTPKTDSGATS